MATLKPSTAFPTFSLPPLKGSASEYAIFFIVGLTLILLVNTTIFLTLSANGEYTLDQPQVYIDETHSIAVNDIVNIASREWDSASSLFIPKTEGRFWVKMKVPTELKKRSLILRLKDPLIDDIQIALVNEDDSGIKNVIKIHTVGDIRPFNARSLALPNLAVPISEKDKVDLLYFGLSSKLSTELEVGVWERDNFLDYNNKWTIFSGLAFGYILALFCYSLMTYITSGNVQYWWYALFMLSCLLHITAMSGHGFQYFWPESPGLQNIMGGVSISLLLVSLLKFTLVIEVNSTRLFVNASKLLIWLHFACLVASLFTLNGELTKVHLLLSLATICVMPILSFLSLKQKNRTAILSMLIWSIMLFSGFVSAFEKSGLVSWPLESLYILFICVHLQILLIAAALAYGFRRSYEKTIKDKKAAVVDKAQAMAAQDEILSLQRHAQEKLAGQVKAQTQQLENALLDLSKASDELKMMRNLDGLTSLPNRLAFEEASERMARVSVDTGEAFCLVIADIDHFKKVNDDYGHLAGDECLRTFAAKLKSNFKQQDYCFCRLGGEEFVLASLLPIEIVKKDMENFRRDIEKMEVILDSDVISFTVSAGIAEKRLLQTNEIKSLYSQADDKLYLAKQKGRNLIIA